MKIAPYPFATDPQLRAETKQKFASGEAVIVESGGSHDEKAINHLASLPDYNKNFAVGAIGGGAAGLAAGVVLDQVASHLHPAVGIVVKILLGSSAAVAGGIIANELAAVAHGTPVEKAASGGEVPAAPSLVDIALDLQARQVTLQLTPQSIK